MSIPEQIKTELDVMRAQRIDIFTDPCDIVLCMKCTMSQLVNCYVTTNREHATKLLVRFVAHVQGHFEAIKQPVIPAARTDLRSFGHGLLMLGRAVDSADVAISRNAVGDAKGHMMDVLGIAYGILGGHTRCES